MSYEHILTCPKCGYDFEMDDPDDWECPNCGNVGIIHWNGDEISFLERESYDIDEIMEDPEANKPSCCVSCDNSCYPDCVSSCSIFED